MPEASSPRNDGQRVGPEAPGEAMDADSNRRAKAAARRKGIR
jgi:hypothetical protein